jgi:hypothetical protein
MQRNSFSILDSSPARQQVGPALVPASSNPTRQGGDFSRQARPSRQEIMNQAPPVRVGIVRLIAKLEFQLK